MKPDAIVFDLDGTLWDTCPACAVAWNNVIQREGIGFRQIEAADVQKVTGHPHSECIQLTFEGLPDDQIESLVAGTITEDTLMIQQHGGVLYEGVPEGLHALADHYRLFIVSNCQSGYIETFFQLSGLGGLFEDNECWGNTRQKKTENLRLVIERNHLISPWMIGDAEGDEIAARNCKIPFGFVAYGFQACQRPDVEFSSFPEVTAYFLGLAQG